jgi:hypothetical protein
MLASSTSLPTRAAIHATAVKTPVTIAVAVPKPSLRAFSSVVSDPSLLSSGGTDHCLGTSSLTGSIRAGRDSSGDARFQVLPPTRLRW